MAAFEHRGELERLYEEHAERVRAICLASLRDRDEAEDAAQQVFLSALRALRGGAAPRDPAAWLATIARHECWARGRRPAPVALHDGLCDVKADDPAAAAVESAELADAWRSIARLPRRQREVLLQRAVRGLGYDELARDLHLSTPAVRSLLTRARRTLRAQLERGAGALPGVPWPSLLGRLFGDGSSPGALTAVTRTAAVGITAVALAGSAVVTPRLATQAQPPRRVAIQAGPQPSQRDAAPVVPRTVVASVRAHPARPAPRLPSAARPDGERGHDAPEHGVSGGDAHEGETSRSSSRGPGPGETVSSRHDGGSGGRGRDGGGSSDDDRRDSDGGS